MISQLIPVCQSRPSAGSSRTILPTELAADEKRPKSLSPRLKVQVSNLSPRMAVALECGSLSEANGRSRWPICSDRFRRRETEDRWATPLQMTRVGEAGQVHLAQRKTTDALPTS